jgi:hypothetical protein
MEEKPVVHLIPSLSVTLKRQLSHAAAAFVGGIGALLSMPVDSWLPHLSAILGPRVKDWGPFLIAVAFFWNFAMKGKDAQIIRNAEKQEGGGG